MKYLYRLADYSDESLLNELHRVSVILGERKLTLDDIDKHARFSHALLKKRFGGLNAALKAAGLHATLFNRNVSDRELLEELARVWNAVLSHEGRRPYTDDLAKYESKYSLGPYYRRWGSWIKACEAVLDWELTSETTASVTEQKVATELPRARTKNTKRSIPLKIRYAILLRDRFTCQLCGRSPSSNPGLEVDIDHMHPESLGGTLDPSNLRCLCKECNLGKGAVREM